MHAQSCIECDLGGAHAVEVAVWAGGVLVEGGGREARERDASEQPREEVGRVDLPQVPGRAERLVTGTSRNP